jgi:hypothetical protein
MLSANVAEKKLVVNKKKHASPAIILYDFYYNFIFLKAYRKNIIIGILILSHSKQILKKNR